MKIYHNPKCSKSRQAKQVLDQNDINYDVQLYLDKPLSAKEIKQLLIKLRLPITAIIRTKEAIWSENFKDAEFTNEELIEIVASNPELLERPIIEHGDFAVVARSDEKIQEILNTY
ncbi:arsenate reductase family protein [Francisella hispaniensis]|uniref:arsenate reductase family protein n=1 Tax=Francisella hispaniensis TaxID=622488 RepID=UPI001902E748|nr:arsenate reductase family protein [Francisella hispaniensis]MBK2356976.1 arsenate reductase family protein [Francisella hispaniensis]